MIRIRHSADRGRTKLPWLDGRHSFSFGNYMDAEHTHFRALRVINDDVIAPGGGFDTHPHRDMEIVTIVLAGELSHRDSMGNGSVIRPGEVQRMTAGTGVLHSERNDSREEPAHLRGAPEQRQEPVHRALQTQHQVRRRLLLDVGVRERAPVDMDGCPFLC